MATTVVGSVTAELILNTEKFLPELKKAQDMVKTFGTIGGINKTTEQIAQLEQRVVNLGNTIQSQTEKINQLETQLKKLDETYKITGESASKLGAEVKNTNESIQLDFSKLAGEMDKLKEKERLLDAENKRLNEGFLVVGEGLKLLDSIAGSNTEKLIQSIRMSNASLKELQAEIMSLAGGLSGYTGEVSKVINSEFELGGAVVNVRNMFSRFNSELSKANGEFNVTNEQLAKTGEFFNLLGMNLAKSGEHIAMFEKNIIKVKEALSAGREFTFFEGILAGSDKAVAGTSKMYQEIEKLKTSLNNLGSNPIRLNISQLETASKAFLAFEKQVDIAQQSLKRFGTTSPNLTTFKTHLNEVYELMGRFGIVYQESDNGSRRWAESIKSASVTLQDYYKNLNQVIQKTKEYNATQTQMATKISAGGTINMSGQLARQAILTQKLKEGDNTLYASTRRNHEALMALKAGADQASASTTRLSTSQRQATSSTNALSSATGKLHGALSSVKMMATALSSMFIWTFGMSLYEATKQTLQSKNEMESYLTKMGLGRGAINLFNQGLDETADRFKKLNKYMIGETIAGIGMEFDLTANQMKESMEVVAMIQNEYVRAGRKESEATLAVKDILQGEFLRLSRETGVGKQDLIDTGLWSGDIKDVVGIMEALKKIGTDRHWDLFAEKCISLNDVISETKNRISEFGAMLGDQFSPVIVSVFNTLVGVIDKVTGTWNNFDPTQKLAVAIPLILGAGTAFISLAGNLSLVEIAQMGYSRALIATILRLDMATVKEYGLITAIVSKITALNGETVAYTGNLTALTAKLLGLDAYILKEYGLTTALNVATGAIDINTVSHDANAVAQAFSNGVTEEGTAVVGGFTVVKELEQAVMESDTALTEFNTIAHEMNKVAIEEETVSLWSLVGAMTAVKAVAFVAVLVGIAVALGSLAMEAQRAKEAVDGFYDIVDNGDDYVKNAEDSVQGYTDQVNNLTNALHEAEAQGKDTFNIKKDLDIANKNLEIAKKNVTDIKNVNAIAKKDAEAFGQQINMANTDFERRNSEIFKKLGIDANEATELASNYTQQYLTGMDQMRTATSAYTHELEEGSRHMADNVENLEKAGASQQTLIKYTQDYGTEVLKNAQYQKEWAEGDFWAIFKIALSDLKLAWIDITAIMGEYEWVKELGKGFKSLGDRINELNTDKVKQLGQDVKALCDFIELLYDLVSGNKGKEIDEYFDALGGTNPTPKVIDDKGQLDLGKYAQHSISEFGKTLSDGIGDLFFDPTQFGSLGIFTSIIDFILPENLSQKFKERVHSIFGEDTFSDIFNTSFGGGTGFLSNLFGDFDLLDSLFGENGVFRLNGDDVKNRFSKSLSENMTGGMEEFLQNPFGDTGFNFDLGQFITNLFNNNDTFDFSWATTFVNDHIITPITDGLNYFFENPLEVLGEFGGIGSLLSALFQNNGEGFDVTTFVNDNIITPFSNAIYWGIMGIPIVGDILALLGLTDQTTPTADEKGRNVGGSFGQAIERKIGEIPIVGDVLRMLGLISSTQPEANSQGHGVGSNIKTGVDNGKQGTANLVRDEMVEVVSAIASKVGEAYRVAQDIGSSIINGINSMLQHHSPGVPAQLVIDEMWEIENAMASAEDGIYLQAQNIGLAITSGIQPNTDISFDAEAMAQYQANTMMAMGMATETVDTSESAFTQLDLTTATTFGSIGNTIGSTMTNISNTTKMNYTNIANTTKTQLANMQSQTTKNIGQIKQSWTGMQTALIASAEHIRSETGAKIHSLQNNMATFWRKVQNPALLLGGGTPQEDHSVKQHRFTRTTAPVRKVLKAGNYAGSPRLANRSPKPMGSSVTGISDSFKPSRNSDGLDMLIEYLECMQSGKPCYAGGWDFNWSDDIKQALLKWHTHFGEIYDPYLYVGKFENDTFPVRGIAPIALRYIQDAISRTNYDYYYNEVYDPLTAWNRGAFNCMDGARLVIALASAFGFGGGYYGHTSWDGIPHVYAIIPGLGVIDATAIQGGYGLTAGKVSYGGAGGDSAKPMFKHNRTPQKSSDKSIGDVNINITINGDVTDDSIGDRIGRRVREEIIDLVNPNPTTGM